MSGDQPRSVGEITKHVHSQEITGRLETMLPPAVEVDRFKEVLLQQLRANPDLVKCSFYSLMSAAYDAAKSGLLPDGVLGQSYIIPFKGKAQFVVGYRGYITLAMNSGQVEEIYAKAVRMGDQFEVEEGTDHRITHKVDYRLGAKGRGDIVAVYAVAKLKGEGHAFEVMSVDEVEAIRQKSPMPNSPAWKNYWEEMAKKTVLRRLCKWLPQSVQRWEQVENTFEATGEVLNLSEGEYQDTTEPEAEPPKSERKPPKAEPPKRRGRPPKNQQPAPEPEEPPPSPNGEAHEAPWEAPPHDPETGEVIEAEAVSNEPQPTIRLPRTGSVDSKLDDAFTQIEESLRACTSADEVGWFAWNNEPVFVKMVALDDAVRADIEQAIGARKQELADAG